MHDKCIKNTFFWLVLCCSKFASEFLGKWMSVYLCWCFTVRNGCICTFRPSSVQWWRIQLSIEGRDLVHFQLSLFQDQFTPAPLQNVRSWAPPVHFSLLKGQCKTPFQKHRQQEYKCRAEEDRAHWLLVQVCVSVTVHWAMLDKTNGLHLRCSRTEAEVSWPKGILRCVRSEHKTWHCCSFELTCGIWCELVFTFRK